VQAKTPKTAPPRLAEPAKGDRIATMFDGRPRTGRITEKFLDIYHVKFEDDAGTTYKFNRTEIWKVREATQ
jgi:hypothetical protein